MKSKSVKKLRRDVDQLTKTVQELCKHEEWESKKEYQPWKCIRYFKICKCCNKRISTSEGDFHLFNEQYDIDNAFKVLTDEGYKICKDNQDPQARG